MKKYGTESKKKKIEKATKGKISSQFHVTCFGLL